MNKSSKNHKRPYIILGCGGHAKVLIDTLQALNHQIAGIISPTPPKDSFFKPFPYLGSDSIINDLIIKDYYFANALGSIKDIQPRAKLYTLYERIKAKFPKIIHPSVIISPYTKLSSGVQIMAGAIINANVMIGKNTLINTGSIVEHDCKIGKHCHIAPGVILSGNTKVAHNVHIGVGALINQNVKIKKEAVIAAGAVVIKEVQKNTLVGGVPAKEIIKNKKLRF